MKSARALINQTVPLLVACLLASCELGGSIAPPFKESRADEPRNLVPTKAGGLSISLPTGWNPIPNQDTNPNVKAVFQKRGTSVTLKVLKLGIFVRRNDTFSLAGADLPANSKLLRGPFTLGSSISSPAFVIFRGTVTSKGREVTLITYVGYNIDKFSGHYGLSMQGSEADARELEAVFRAILSST